MAELNINDSGIDFSDIKDTGGDILAEEKPKQSKQLKDQEREEKAFQNAVDTNIKETGKSFLETLMIWQLPAEKQKTIVQLIIITINY